MVEPSAFTSGQKEAGSRFDWPWTSCLHSTRLGGDYAFCAFFYLASHGVSGSLTSSVYGDGASAADPASIVNQVQFAEIRSPMESTIGIKRIKASSCKSQKENRSPDGQGFTRFSFYFFITLIEAIISFPSALLS